jgi:hypothetical protein
MVETPGVEQTAGLPSPDRRQARLLVERKN